MYIHVYILTVHVNYIMHTQGHIQVYMHVYTCTYMHVHVYIYVYTCIYTHCTCKLHNAHTGSYSSWDSNPQYYHRNLRIQILATV